jgi:hypothetical protein
MLPEKNHLGQRRLGLSSPTARHFLGCGASKQLVRLFSFPTLGCRSGPRGVSSGTSPCGNMSAN